MNRYPLPRPLREALEGAVQAPRIEHPGLLMDRYAGYQNESFAGFDQEQGQQPHINAIVAAAWSWDAGVLPVWQELFRALPEPRQEWTQTTIWRLAAHLSRASVLENGSICLHPIYGFPFLPGQGLKGLAQAFAESVAHASLADRQRIFGCGPAEGQRAGSVVFIESWPAGLARLDKDIVNNHHRVYYSGGIEPPGDWESPNPVYFLAVAGDVTFRFGVAVRSQPVTDAARQQAGVDVAQAREWLQAALSELGFGAKTAAGYGYFGPAAS